MTISITALITAFLLDFFLGDPPNRFHPVVAMGQFIRHFTRKWNCGSKARRFWLGACLILSGAMVFSLPWVAFIWASTVFPDWVTGILTGILLKPTFAYRGLLKAGDEVRAALMSNDLNEARRLVAWHLVSRDTSELTGSQVASAAIESLAENLTDSFFAPLFFFMLGGLPLAWAYRFINTADAMIGYHTSELEYFGKFTARLDDILNWFPARFSGYLIVLAAWLGRFDASNALRVMLHQHSTTGSPNAGWTMSAAAGALRIILEKPGYYCLLGSRKEPDWGDLKKAKSLVTISLILGLVLCGGLIIVRFIFF
jgi:adenosylcobinamide-phosphate synthase